MNAQSINSQQVIATVQTIPLDELEQLVSNVLAVRAERIAPHITGEESKILRTIQKTLPKKNLVRMKELQALRDKDQLSPKGFAELAGLIEKLEIFHSDRMKAVSDLAELRGVTLQTAIKQIGLKLPDYE
ncbi:MAG: hypothetical protein AAB336_13795 [Acidobacteriota bacterium]